MFKHSKIKISIVHITGDSIGWLVGCHSNVPHGLLSSPHYAREPMECSGTNGLLHVEPNHVGNMGVLAHCGLCQWLWW